MIRFPTILCALLVGAGAAFSQQTLPARAEQARLEAAAASTEVLKAMLESDDPPRQHSALRELAARKTNEARALLLQAALGGYGKRARGVAANWLFESLDDTAQARELLQWETLADRALSKMRGIAVDAALWEYVRPRMESSDLGLRFTCVGLLQDDPAGFDPVAKVSALLASLTSAVDLPAAKERSGFDGMVISGHTRLDDYFSAVTRTLASAKDVTVEVLRGQTPAEDGLAREAVIIARRRRGDREVASEIRQVMETGHVTMARLMAIEMRVPRDGRFSALEPEEIEVLRRVASTDPYSFRPGQRWRGDRPELRFPVREAAVSALERDTAWLIREEVSAQVRQLAQAYAKYDQPSKEELRRQLVAGGDAVLTAILLERQTLLTGTNREAAESVIATLPGPKAEQTAIDFLLASTNAPIESDLGRIFIPRAHQEGLAVDLPLADWNWILERICHAGEGSYSWASLALCVQGNRPPRLSDAVVDLWVNQVNVPVPSNPGPVFGTYVSAESVRLVSYLNLLERCDRERTIARLKAALPAAQDSRVALWYKIALGRLGETTVTDDLLAAVDDPQVDLSGRTEALRAYAEVAGETARPVLERYLQDTNLLYGVPSGPALATAARGALSKLNSVRDAKTP